MKTGIEFAAAPHEAEVSRRAPSRGATKRGEPTANAGRYTVAVVDRALRLLQAVARRPGQRMTAIAAATGTTNARTFRLLATLEQAGFVRQNEEGKYRLGVQALVLSEFAREQLDLPAIAQPHLEMLAERTGETVLVRVIDGLASVCVAKVDSRHEFRVHPDFGVRRPLHVGSGKLLLAFAPPALVARIVAAGLPRFTPNTTVTAVGLRAQLARIREQGYGVSRGERIEGALAIGVPIRDERGEVVASLSIAGPAMRLSDKIDSYVGMLHKAALKIGEGLGGSAAAAARDVSDGRAPNEARSAGDGVGNDRSRREGRRGRT
jgi:DNA-binding IclR family transcriptional regulator